MNRVRRAACALALGAAWAIPSVASAAPRTPQNAVASAAGSKANKAVEDGLDAKALDAKLRSGKPELVREALATAQAAGPAAAAVAPSIEGLLTDGASLEIAKAAVEALGAIGAPSSSAVLAVYMHHRAADVRRAAAKAIAATKGYAAVIALKEGLRSFDPQVRGFAATGLGTLGASDALPDLFAALERNVPEAAASIGLLCAPADCDRFTSKLGGVGLDVMIRGLDPIFVRAEALGDDELVKVVGRVRALGTKGARSYLEGVQSRWPAAASPRVKAAIDEAVASLASARSGS